MSAVADTCSAAAVASVAAAVVGIVVVVVLHLFVGRLPSVLHLQCS